MQDVKVFVRPHSQTSARLNLAASLWGWKPHASQREWMLDDSDIKVAACGRRWGKTESEAIDAATYALLFPGSRQMVVAPTYDQSRLIAGRVESLLWAHAVTRRLVSVKKTPYPQINVCGSEISARTADEDGRNLRGHRADRVIVDEAAYVRESVIREVIQPMLADSGGQLILISTPFGRNHFWRAWQDGKSGKDRIRSFRFPSESNPHISASYIEAQRRELPPRAFGAEYLAEFIEDSACVFAWADIDACAKLECAAATPFEQVIVAGIDWARYSDYTACVAIDVRRRPWQIVSMDRFQGLSWEGSVERVSRFLEDCRALCALCDSTSVGDPLLERLQVRMSGSIEVSGLVFTQSSKRELVDNLAIRIAHREIALSGGGMPYSDVLRAELEAYEYRMTAAGSVTYSAPEGRHDDLVMALALAARQASQAPDMTVLTAGRGAGDYLY